MIKEIIDSIKPELEKVIEYTKQKLGSIRTGRANPALIENVLVEMYGSKMPLKQIAAISVLDAKKIRVDPWDKSYIEAISSAIQNQSSLSASSDSSGVFVNMPELSEEVRKDMVKAVGQIDDNAKKTIRKWRDEAWSKMQKYQKEGLISEDQKFKGKEDLQKMIDEYNKKADELIDNKKRELEA